MQVVHIPSFFMSQKLDSSGAPRLVLIHSIGTNISAIQIALETAGFQVKTARDNPQEILNVLQAYPFDVMLWMASDSGRHALTSLRDIKCVCPALSCLLVVEKEAVQVAISAIRAGIDHYCKKPASLERLVKTCCELVSRKQEKHPEVFLKDFYQKVKTLASSHDPVLIYGEPGTECEWMAHFIHRHSSTCQQPFDTIALPDNGVETHMIHWFGKEAGACHQPGSLETAKSLYWADGYTLPDKIQHMLAEAFTKKSMCRVGSAQAVPIRARLFVTLRQDPLLAVAQGWIAKEFWNCLRNQVLYVPPLRERPIHTLLWAQQFLEEFGKLYTKSVQFFSAEVEQTFLQHSWPGNVDEVKAVVEYSVLQSKGKQLDVRALPAWFASRFAQNTDLSLLRSEKKLVFKAMDVHRGNKSAAAHALGISRRTLYSKLKAFGL